MICYKDRTYCSASFMKRNCFNTDCFRYLTKEEMDRATSLGLPIARSNFFDTCNMKVEHDQEMGD